MPSDSPIPDLVARWRVFWTRRRIILLAVLLAAGLRLWAAWQLPGDFDEPVYLQAGREYAQMMRAGDWGGILAYPYNSEHPPLVKLLYALGFLSVGEERALLFARLVSGALGVLAVFVVARIDPLAGVFLAVQTLVVKYTSQAYLEALPLLGVALAVYLLLNAPSSEAEAPGRSPRFWLSAAALGLTAASKYSYFPIVVVILYLLWQKKTLWLQAAAYFGAAALAFVALDPALWLDPPGRLWASLSFHAAYSQSAHVQGSGYPWYQPFLWISRSWGFTWHPQVFFYFGFDGALFLMALAGLRGEFRQRRWALAWLAAGLLFLLLWPTKWPQYTLVLMPALCLAAAAGWRVLLQWVMEKESYYNWLADMLPRPTRTIKIAIGLFVGAIAVGAVVYYTSVFINRLGWSHLDAYTTPLPGNTVNDLLALPDGRMAIATDGGLALFDPQASGAARWQVFTHGDAALPDDRVLALAQAGDGSLWVGTGDGLARYGVDGRWTVSRAGDLGLADDQVNALAFGPDGRLWVGTNRGVAAFDGARWRAYTRANSGLMSDFVLSVEAQQKTIWVGTKDGLSRLELADNSWEDYTISDGLGWGGIADLLVDSQSRLWVCTLGGGVSRWDGRQWEHFRVNNSGLPYNSVQKIAETPAGAFWVAASLPNDVGGLVARFDGETWQVYRPILSGYSGMETLAIVALDGEVWFGGNLRGVDVYRP